MPSKLARVGTRIAAALVMGLTAVSGCDRTATSQAPAAPARVHVEFDVTRWPLPPINAAAQPDLVRAADGALLLSWIEPIGSGHALRFARFAGGTWAATRTVAQGDDWFVNWADTPHVQATADGAVWAHWLRKSAAATYAYDVVLSRSADGGATWSAPVAVNDDGTPTEHGFASLWPASRDRIGIAWLDGRKTGGGDHGGHAGHGGGGAMTLRSASFDTRLQRSGETELDASTCDCCQTDVVGTPRGPVLAYRDRTHDEIRDIAVTRLDGGTWTPPRIVHADGWRMPGCPVNGPASASRAADVVVGWYTEAGGTPSIRIARSTDAGDTFAQPSTIATGTPLLGRVGVALTSRSAWITWLREDDRVQSLWLARLAPDLSRVEHVARIATMRGRGRGTGLPQLVADGDAVRVVWTDVIDGTPVLQGAVVR